MKKNPFSMQPNVEQLLEWQRPYITNPKPDDFVLAGTDEKQSFIVMRESTSSWQDAWRRLKKNYVAMTAFGVLIFILIFAFAGPIFVPYSYEQEIRGSGNLKPMQYSEGELERMAAGQSVFPHVFGTDNAGRDLMARVMYGTRISLIIGVFASLIVLVIGTLYGSISGFFGGSVDFVMMRIVEIIYAIPEMLMVLLLSAVIKEPLKNWINTSTNPLIHSMGGIGHGIISIFIVFGLLYWVGMSRIIRGQVLLLKQQEFVTASRALGASSARIIQKHLLPNCVGQIIVTTMMQIPSAIFLESFLSYLGMGVSAPTASLGSLASDALGGIYSYPSRLIIPSVFLCVLILSFNLFGDGLRDALDPRMKK